MEEKVKETVKKTKEVLSMEQKVKELRDSVKMQEAFAFVKKDAEHTLEQQLKLVKIPSFSNHEEEKAKYFKKLIEAEGCNAEMDDVWNVFTRIKGTGEGPTVYITAHTDTVFPLDTPLEITEKDGRYTCPGIGDDTRGLAEILSILRTIKKCSLKPKGDIIIGSNVGEEGLGNLKGMRNFFKNHAEEVDGFISIDGVGSVIIYGGTGSLRYRVTFRGPGGHSYGAFGLVNPIFAMGRAISNISEIRTPLSPKTTFCVGVVKGGTSVNSIASECSMLVDMRSDGQKELDELHQKFQDCIKKAVEDENNRWTEERKAKQGGMGWCFDRDARITVKVELLGNRPVGNQPIACPIVQVAADACNVMGTAPEYMSNGSTDANIPISLGIPAIAVNGGGKSAGMHSTKEWFEPKDAYIGVQRNLLTLFALTGLDGASEPMLAKRKR
jgi:tripeptide aminopeptidase